MTSLPEERLRAYREETFRLRSDLRVTTLKEALGFVQARGFIFFWPIKGMELPSLWYAAAGYRPVAAAHDDPGHITWGWKDEMLSQRRWYYGKLLRGKGTMVSLQLLPYFYALSPRVADLDDFRTAYQRGELTREALQVGEALLEKGVQHTLQLRSETNTGGRSSKYRFEKALTDLQRGLWILPVGVARAGAWRYAFLYELFDRWFPEVPEKARDIPLSEARASLTGCYLDSVGAAPPKDIARLFGWRLEQVRRSLERLEATGRVVRVQDGTWATSKLV